MTPQIDAVAAHSDHEEASGPATDDIRIPMFHGTRRSYALAIQESGFAPRPVMDQLRSVAEDHGLEVEEVIADLEKHCRYAIADPRPNTLYVVGNQSTAGSWADRAPEATWEALWAVYRIRHPHLGNDWLSSNEGHLWVLAQRLLDPPAVVEVAAPLGSLRAMTGSTAAESLVRSVSSGQSLREAIKFLYRAPEWRIDPDAAVLTSVVEVPQRVNASLVYFLSGEDEETFLQQLAAGRWGEPAGEHTGTPWHSYRDVWDRLEPRRRAELEELIGLPLTPSA